MRPTEFICRKYMNEYVRLKCAEVRYMVLPRDVQAALLEVYNSVNKDCDSHGIPRIPVPLYLVLSTEADWDPF